MTTETTQATPQLVRGLKLRDLILFNLVAVLGLRHLGTTAKFGPGSLLMWLIAAFFFFIPQGLAVIELSSRFPKEAGFFLDETRVRRRSWVFVRLVLLDQQRPLLSEPPDFSGGDRDFYFRERRDRTK